MLRSVLPIPFLHFSSRAVYASLKGYVKFFEMTLTRLKYSSPRHHQAWFAKKLASASRGDRAPTFAGVFSLSSTFKIFLDSSALLVDSFIIEISSVA